MSFGDKIERELELRHKLQLRYKLQRDRKQNNPEQTDNIQKNMLELSANKQIEEKSNVSVQESICKKEYENLKSNKNEGLLIINSSSHM